MAEKLYFDSIKEHCGPYFVVYSPPIPDWSFATLSLTFPEDVPSAKAAQLMELELERWITRYPVPLMVTSFDASDSVIDPERSKENAHLVGWLNPETNKVESSWKLDDMTVFTGSWCAPSDWCTIYADVPYRTDTQVKANAEKSAQETRKQNRILKVILGFWLSVIPASLALIEFFGPEAIGFAVLVFSLWKAWRAWGKLQGHVKPSPRESEVLEKQRRMDDYFYHCERNPEGFLRLRSENLEKDIRERTLADAAELAELEKQRTSRT